MGIGSLIGAGISAAGSLFGSSSVDDAAQAAADAQVKSAQIAAQTQQGFFDQAKNALTPYMNLGSQASTTLGNRLDSLTTAVPVPTMTQADLEATPGYQFTLGQGLKATQNSAAARGLGLSGAALKGAASYATGLSDNTYNTRFGQAQTQFEDATANNTNAFNKLYSTAGLGTSAAGALAGQAITTGQGIAQAQTNAGDAQASAALTTGKADAAAATGISSSFNNALQQYMSGGTSKGLFGSGSGNQSWWGSL